MGATNSHSVSYKGVSLPIFADNSYTLYARSFPNATLPPHSIFIRSMSRQHFEQWRCSLKQLSRFNEYIQLPKRYVWKVDCMCSEYGALEIQYQDGIYTLNHEITYRSARQQYFQEYELWYVLLLIINLQFNISEDAKKDSYWNIHPQSILLTQEGYVKIIMSVGQQDRDGQKAGEFVPPEEIPLLLLKLIKSNDERVMMRVNRDISETFQLGLTLLSAANLTHYDSLYSFSPLLTLSLQRLQVALDYLAQTNRYTVVLSSLIANLCSFNPAHRLSGPQLWEWVTDHAEQIRRKSSFSFKYLPRKLSSLVAARIKDNQQDLLRNSRLKMEKLSASQVGRREKPSSPQRHTFYEKHLYQPIHQIGRHAPPRRTSPSP